MNKTAIILITKNRKKLFDQTINSLISNTHKDLYDLIVVDDGSSYLEDLIMLKKSGIISDLILTNFGSVGIARNLGVEIAKRKGYKYIYHTDNDMYFLSGWLEKCVRIKESYKEIAIVGPYCHPFMQKNADKEYTDEIETVDAVSGNSWFMTLDDFCLFGLKETKGIMASEDWEMCQRLREAKRTCVRLTPHLVLHCGVTNSNEELSTGADIMLEELSKAKIKYNLKDLYYE